MICRRALVLSLAVLACLTGCAFGGNLRVEPVAVTAQKPSNVALFVAVSEHGHSVLALQPESFSVLENGVLLDSRQVGLTLLPTPSAVARRALLLVDMSRSLDDAQRAALESSLRALIVKLRARQIVSLYAFDGSEHVHYICDYAKDARAEPDEKDTSMQKLLSFSRSDASSSLYSAVLEATHKLDASLSADKLPIGLGTMIVIAQNPDLAGRASEEAVRSAIDAAHHQYFLVMVGPWSTDKDIAWLGKNGAVRAGSLNTMLEPLQGVADQIDEASFRYYLVSYCSPARAGTRRLELRVTTSDEQGKKSEGSYRTDFEATGFGPGCNAQSMPRFPATKSP
ncbi:MAG TPA: hypothetical protein VGM29_06270 [Polyangiaceae bacterium]|jgi:hypothetical protein